MRASKAVSAECPLWHGDPGVSMRAARLACCASLLAAGVAVSLASELTFQVDMSAQRAIGAFNPQGGDTVLVSGTFSNPDWSTTSRLSAIASNADLYLGAFNNDVPVGKYVAYKFIINPGGNSAADKLNWESGDNRQSQVSSANQVLPLEYFDHLTNLPPASPESLANFVSGADMSHLVFFESRGASYKAAGVTGDALQILKQQGLNCIRLRIFTSSPAQAQADPYNAINNLDYTLPLGLRVKNAGLKLLLDFHYSDSWADPGKQTKPSSWTNLTFSQLSSRIRAYSSNTIAAFKAAGAMPDWVQVGNEITPGMLWNEGRVGGSFDSAAQWSQFGQLLTNAIQGVKDASGPTSPKIVIHIDRGGDWGSTRWFFDKLAEQQVPFDIIGQSYYPFWHGDLAALRACLANTALRYRKPVVVMETAFPFANSTNIVGIPATTNGQVQFVIELAKIVKSVPGGLGAGIFWWGSEYQQIPGYNLAGFDRRSLFFTNGNVLPGAGALGALTSPVKLSPAVSTNTLILKWPLSGAGMALKTSTNLAPGSWTNVTNTVQDTDAVFTTCFPLEQEEKLSRFFRLQSP